MGGTKNFLHGEVSWQSTAYQEVPITG